MTSTNRASGTVLVATTGNDSLVRHSQTGALSMRIHNHMNDEIIAERVTTAIGAVTRFFGNIELSSINIDDNCAFPSVFSKKIGYTLPFSQYEKYIQYAQDIATSKDFSDFADCQIAQVVTNALTHRYIQSHCSHTCGRQHSYEHTMSCGSCCYEVFIGREPWYRE